MGALNRYSPWPHPYLTEQEARGCALYRTVLPDKTVVPGLLRRVYPFQLIKTTFPGEQNVLSVRYVTSGLKTLLFGVTFSGDPEFWQLSIRTASGEILFDTAPVSALLNLPFMDNTEMLSDASPENDILLRPNAPPYTWDPPWVVDGTQALQIDGDILEGSYLTNGEGQPARGVLNFAFHVWEIPGTNDSRGPQPPKPLTPPRPMVPALRAGPGSQPGRYR